MPLEVEILTLFPEMLAGPLAASIPGHIQEEGSRQFASTTFGPGAWGVTAASTSAPSAAARGWCSGRSRWLRHLAALRRPDSTIIRSTPPASPSGNGRAEDLATRPHLVFVCPRYEGVDERIRAIVDLELSIGDFVLTGGELPALVVCDAVLRLLPGAIESSSLTDESFTSGLLEYPRCTRPGPLRGTGRTGDAHLGRPRRRASVAAPQIAPADAGATTGTSSRGGRSAPKRRAC